MILAQKPLKELCMALSLIDLIFLESHLSWETYPVPKSFPYLIRLADILK